MELEPGAEDEGPFFAWLPPEDRLWRHPSETGEHDFASAQLASLGAGRAASGLLRAAASSASGKTWTVAVIAGLVGALAASGLGMATGWWNHKTTVVQAELPATSEVSLSDPGSGAVNWTALEDAVAPNVVSVNVQAPTGPQTGSGLVLTAPGDGKAFVVTDRALFAPSQSAAYNGRVEVSFLSGDTARGRLVGEDPLSGLAIVEVPNVVRSLPLLGTVADLHDADEVLAVGARDQLGGYVFTGSVTGEDREADLADGSEVDELITLNVPSMTQSAAGGPVLDRLGRVVAVTVDPQLADSSQQPVAFAVPIDEVKRVATQIIDGQAVTHAWLGITDADDLPSMMAHQYGLPGGVQADAIEPGSPAAHIGMGPHDVITRFDGRPVSSAGALISLLDGCNPGQMADITYMHAGKTVQTTVKLGTEPDD